MRSFKFQHAYLKNINQLWIFLMVMISISWITAFDELEGDKTFNLKIGFDLTPGSQGSSALRIRNFEGSNRDEHPKRALRAASSSSGEESEEKKEIVHPSVEMKAADDTSLSDESDESDGDRRQKSTKGLRADEYEPEAGPFVREAGDKDTESDNSN